MRARTAECDKECILDATVALVLELQELEGVATVEKVAHRQVPNTFAASETTGNLMWASLVVVACTPGLMGRLREEQAAVVAMYGADVEGSLSYDAIMSEMPLLEATTKETVRVIPPAQIIFRRMVQDAVVGGYTLRKGQRVAIPMTLPHVQQAWDGKDMTCDLPAGYSHATWAETFQPDRWLGDGDKPTVHTFGFGPHRCVGVTLAYLEVRNCLDSGCMLTLGHTKAERFSLNSNIPSPTFCT